MRIVIIADDNTGATDAAGMLTSYGARALLVLDHAVLQDASLLEKYDVIVAATRIRSVSSEEAYRKTADVISALKKIDFDLIQLKYSSTFDSTPEGNIGQSLDAVCDMLELSSALVCPALPVNGRRTYLGYHFVNDQLLSESPMKNHPLNPMTDSNLLRWLSSQTQRRTGLVDWHTIQEGTEAVIERRRQLVQEGSAYHISDALTQEDIERTVDAYADSGFLSGGSGVSKALGKKYFTGRKPQDYSGVLSKLTKQVVVISGSESPATRAQKQHALDAGFKEILVHPKSILNNTLSVEKTALNAAEFLKQGHNVIVSLDRRDGGDVASVDSYAAKKGISIVETGNRIGEFLGKTANELIRFHGLQRILVAGGETSGSVCHECGFEALEVGLPLDPGVPFCFPSGERNIFIVLKSGNFGRKELYTLAASYSC